jgi:hypothetical protein
MCKCKVRWNDGTVSFEVLNGPVWAGDVVRRWEGDEETDVSGVVEYAVSMDRE